MRAAVIIGVVAVAAGGITFLKALYEVGKEMNQFRTCSSGQNHRR